MDLYDEFGNYIGPELGSEDEEELSEDEGDFGRASSSAAAPHSMVIHEDNEDEENTMDVAADENRIVLHEDKKYYPDAEEVYPGVKTVTLDEDAQELHEPIIKPVKQKQFSALLRETPKLKVENEFLAALMHSPALIRNVVLLGQLHSGKSSFCDLLVRDALESQENGENERESELPQRYTDTRVDEQARGLSIKTSLLSLPLEDERGKHYLLNVLDAPGHANFADEAVAGIAAADGAVLVVDAVEGVMMNTERLLKAALRARLSIALVINKVDRLILELKLPPQDAFFKLMHTLEEVNTLIAQHTLGGERRQRLSPELGNVCFASALHGWCFSLSSFAQVYLSRYANAPFSAQDLSKRLWGDWIVNTSTNVISKKKVSGGGAACVRTFVHFVLEPLYKLYAHAVGENSETLSGVLRGLGVRLTARELVLDPLPLLRVALSRFLGAPCGFVTMCVRSLPSPSDNAQRKTESEFAGAQNTRRAAAMRECRALNAPTQHSLSSSSSSSTASAVPLTAHAVKLLSAHDGEAFLALIRVYSGLLRVGERVRVLGEAYTADDDEDQCVCCVEEISLSLARSLCAVDVAPAGTLVLVRGVDRSIKKTATICEVHANTEEDSDYEEKEVLSIFCPLSHALLQSRCVSVLKLSVEPQVPSELPKMVEALRRLSKSYLSLTTKVEESGEHVLLGAGELSLDCALHDLRHLHSDIEIKVSDPVVLFAETVADSSALNCIAQTPNKKNTLTLLTEPLEEALCVEIEALRAPVPSPQSVSQTKRVSAFFAEVAHWDALSSRSVWAFGPDEHSPNVLVNHTLPSEVSPALLNTVRESLIQGFQWATREGPLCDEMMRNVKCRVLDVTLSGEAIHRGGGQMIPTTRRAMYSSFLMSTPRLMEPVLLVEMQSPADCVQAIYPVLARRRGHVVQDAPKPGAPFYTVKAFLPAMDSFGFETDLRSYTMGQVFSQQVFDHWAVVPGDPLDKDVILHPLEPSPPLALARDFMVKTRRRKGLSEDVSVNKYLDDMMLLQLAKHEAEQGMLM